MNARTKVKCSRDYLYSLNAGSLLKTVAAGMLCGLCAFLSQDKISVRELLTEPARLRVKRNTFHVVELARALQLFHNQNAVILDTRDPKFFGFAHVQRAINVPPSSWPSIDSGFVRRLAEAPVVLVYCNFTCNSSQGLARLLVSMGLDNVNVYAAGWEEWSSCRLPIELAERGDFTATTRKESSEK